LSSRKEQVSDLEDHVRELEAQVAKLKASFEGNAQAVARVKQALAIALTVLDDTSSSADQS
jgi:hypothetical protein